MRAGALVILSALIAACAPTASRPPAADATPSTPRAAGARAAVVSEEPWRFGGAEGRIIRTEHYRLYTTATNPVLVSRVPEFVESALAHYRSAIAPLPAPPMRLDTYLMANRGQWADLSRRLLSAEAEQVLRIPRGGYASRGIGVYFDIGLYDTLAIAAHEGWHQYTQRTFREPLPIWLEEGIAAFMEGHRWIDGRPVFSPWSNVERFDQLRKASSLGKLVSLDELLEQSPQGAMASADEGVLTYYAQLWVLTLLLFEDDRYRTGLARVVIDAAEGRLGLTMQSRLGDRAARGAMARRNGPAAALTYFGSDLERLSRDYDALVAVLVQPGARDRVVRGESPLR